jgi:hypothetical protein
MTNTTVQTQLAIFVYEASNVRHSQLRQCSVPMFISSNYVIPRDYTVVCIYVDANTRSLVLTRDANRI